MKTQKREKETKITDRKTKDGDRRQVSETEADRKRGQAATGIQGLMPFRYVN